MRQANKFTCISYGSNMIKWFQSVFFLNDPIWPDHRWWFRGNHMELSPSGFISGRWIIRTFPDDRMICTMWRVGLDYITHLLGVGQWIILISPDSSCFQGHYIYHSIPITLISLLYSYYILNVYTLYPDFVYPWAVCFPWRNFLGARPPGPSPTST